MSFNLTPTRDSPAHLQLSLLQLKICSSSNWDTAIWATKSRSINVFCAVLSSFKTLDNATVWFWGLSCAGPRWSLRACSSSRYSMILWFCFPGSTVPPARGQACHLWVLPPPSIATTLKRTEQYITIYCLSFSKHLIIRSRNLPLQLLSKKEVRAHKAEEETREALWFLAQEEQGS